MTLLHYKMNHLSLLFHKKKSEVDKQHPSKLNHNFKAKNLLPHAFRATFKSADLQEIYTALLHCYETKLP